MSDEELLALIREMGGARQSTARGMQALVHLVGRFADRFDRIEARLSRIESDLAEGE